MTERSWPWPGVTLGDAGPYTSDEWDDMFEMRFGSGVAPYNDRGVIRNWANELEVTDGGVNQADVDTGAALVHGKHYDNDAVVNIVVPSSVGAWREDLICLQSDWVAQTIRITRINNPADGVVYPAPTQTDGVTWEIPLAAVRIDAAGAITQITDLRDYVSSLVRWKQLQVHPMAYPGASEFVISGDHAVVQLNSPTDAASFEFVVPFDFISLRSATIYYFPAGTGTWDWQVDMESGACGENRAAVTDTMSNTGEAVTNLIIECLDVTNALDGIAALDLVGLDIWLVAIAGATAINIAKLIIEYE